MSDLAPDRPPTAGCACATGCSDVPTRLIRSRRDVLLTGGVVVAAAAVTAACGGSDSTPSTPSGAVTGSAPADAGASGGGGLSTADVPVGGGAILTDRKIVVTQPKAGQFKAFTAVCTHRGCTVAAVSDGLIRCPCHGSQYSIADGSVQVGPATLPLAPVTVTVTGTTITVG